MSGKVIKKIAVSTGIGAGIGILFSSLIIFAMAAVLAVGDIPAMLIAPATVIALAMGGFCGGFASAKICREKGLICGLVSGIIFFLVLWMCGEISGNGDFGTGAVIKAAMIISACSFGGIIGVNYIKRK